MGEPDYSGDLWYDLDHNRVGPEGFAAVLTDPRRVIAQTHIAGRWLVSTVFLGVDYGFGRTERPILYETMVFGPDEWDGEWQRRYCTREEAIIGHANAITMVEVLEGFPEPF